MFRNWNRVVLAAATGLCLAGGPAAAKSSAVALVCDGEFRLQTARIDGTDETMFGGTMHVALVAEENSVVEVRLQSYEDGMKMPIQTFRLPLVEEEPDLGDVALLFPELLEDEDVADEDTAPAPVPSPGVLTIDTSAKQVVLQQTVESGPMMKARIDGRPLVPTRQKIETVEMRLDRTSGDLSMIWSENSVRDHRRPGAIRASKVRLRDEKSYRAVCMPVRQRTF